MRRALLVPALFALSAVYFVGCGEDNTGSASSDAAADPLKDVVVMEGDTVEVASLDNSFDPQNIQVTAGTTVVWENRGQQDHDVVPVEEDGWGVAQEEFAPGDVYEHTFDEPGTYRYYCSLHGDPDAGMIGAVVVEEPAQGEDGQVNDS